MSQTNQKKKIEQKKKKKMTRNTPESKKEWICVAAAPVRISPTVGEIKTRNRAIILKLARVRENLKKKPIFFY